MISVLMSIYKEKRKWVEESVQSILSQTYKDIELIIIIDNPQLSSDVYEYLSSILNKDDRVQLYYNRINIGLAMSMNLAISKAKGEYIARMDGDDISLPNRLEIEHNYLLTNKVDMVTANVYIINEDGMVTGKDLPIPTNLENELLYSNCIKHPTVMIKRNVIVEVGGYRDFPSGQDYDLWLRLLSSGYHIGVINQYLLKYRINSNAISSSHRLEQFYISKYQLKLYKQRRKKGIDSFSRKNLNMYLKEKRITDIKNKKAYLALQQLDIGKKRFAMRELSYLGFVFHAFVISPKITICVILNFIRRTVTRITIQWRMH